MRKELKEIEKKLTDNGWTLSVPARDDEMSEYMKNYNNGKNDKGEKQL